MNEATIRTTHDAPATVAAAVSPDNTAEMTTAVEDGAVVTHIERDSIGGLRATIEDYLRAIAVADETTQLVSDHDKTNP